MPAETKVLYNKRLLTDKEAFKYYRENQKHRTLDVIGKRQDFSVIVRTFYKKLAEEMLENPNGVFIRGFGYFTNVMNPIKEVDMFNPLGKDGMLLLNTHTNGRKFHPMFLPITKQLKLRFFTMDKRFNKKVRVELSKKLKKKVKYYNHYSLLNSMFKNKD